MAPDDAVRLPAGRGAGADAGRPPARRHAGLRAAAADAGRGARAPDVRRGRLARVAVRLGDARRRPAHQRRQRDRRRAPEPDGPRRRLAEPRGRRRRGSRRRWSATWSRSAARSARARPSPACTSSAGARPASRWRAASASRRRSWWPTSRPAGCCGSRATRWAATYARELRGYRLGPATLKVDWALSAPIPWKAPEAREAGTVHVGGDEDEVARRAVADRQRPAREAVHAARPADGRRPDAGAGGQAHRVGVHARPAGRRLGGRDGAPRGAHGGADRALRARLPRRDPRAATCSGPAELERRDANLVGGDVGAGSYTLDQVVFRPVPSLNPYRTPVRGLFIGSAATFPGGAVHGVPGHAAARAALREGASPPLLNACS